ncbi:MAG: TRAP transporter small permease subunit, partial [Gammaproteobacteria bacterium]|nr:TRAP transporter small permease subunit [Gammaproteobacteria bacterium]
MEKIASHIDKLNQYCGRVVSWLTLTMVITTFLVVVMRYLFNIGSIALQESITWMHALVFMVGVSYTLKREGHVRVDIFYQKMSPRLRAWVNLSGTLFFLLPLFGFILWACWDYVLFSWSLNESSQEAGGLPYLFLLKTLLLIMPVLMIL